MSDNPKHLWIGGYGPEKSAHGEGLEAIRRGIETATNGEIEVRVTWNIMDDGRKNTDLFDLVEAGSMFLCYFSSSYLGQRVSELNVLETPYLFSTPADAHKALDGELGSALRGAVRSKTGFEALGFWDNGFRHFTNRIRPVRSPADCRGMTVRMQPNAIHEELIRSWGASPVAVELNEAIRQITSLQVDAQENPLANTVAYGVARVHPYVTMTGHLYGARGLFAHRQTLEQMSGELRSTITDTVTTAIGVQRSAAARLEEALRTKLEAGGTQFVDLTEDERQVFVEASAPAIALAHRDVPGFLYELIPA